MNSNMKGILGSSFYELPPPSFLLILEIKLFGEPREKISRPHHLFSFFPTTQPNTLQKVFVPIFSQKVSIHPISSSNRHTLRGKRGGGGGKWPWEFIFVLKPQPRATKFIQVQTKEIFHPFLPKTSFLPSIYPLKKITYLDGSKSTRGSFM